MHTRIGRYDNRMTEIGGAQRFVTWIIEREIDEPIVDQVDRRPARRMLPLVVQNEPRGPGPQVKIDSSYCS